MEKIKTIGVQSGNPVTDENVQLLDQVNQLYTHLNSILPPSSLKQDVLMFTDNKRREYIARIVMSGNHTNTKT